jgi:diketogulonate reductase-like aldo/keto reductase
MVEYAKTLPSGDELPVVGIGTWDIHGETVKQSVRCGLDAGYTHIDTAEGYDNEEEIGTVISSHDRESIWLTSKVLPKHLHYESVIESCRNSLERLGTEYLDLYLIHWPNPAISLRETLNAMTKLYNEGLVRNIGVSNFTAYQLSCAQHISDVPIAVNQIEYHPWFTQDPVVEYCHDTNTIVEAAAPLGRTEVFADETIQNLADTYDRSPANIILRWAIENEIVVLPKSSTQDHIQENLEILDWELDPVDHDRIDSIEMRRPIYDFPSRAWEREVYGISQ